MAKKTYIKNNGIWKEVKNVCIKVNGEWKEHIIPKGIIDSIWREFIQDYVLKTKTHNFGSSTSRSRSTTLTLDGLISIDSVVVNTGVVTYTVSGNKVTIQVNSGSGDSVYDSTKYSKTESITTFVQPFQSTVSYDSDGYSGTLYKSGSSYVFSGSYEPSDTKYVESYSTFYAEADIQSTKVYNSLGYYGVLSLIGSRWEGSKIISAYGGNVTKPSSDTRVYAQKYSGTVYMGGYTTYYSYKVNINYKSKPTN